MAQEKIYNFKKKHFFESKYMYDVTASIVLYQNNPEELNKAIQSFLKTGLKIKLYLIDNSPTNVLQTIANRPNIEYHFMGKNLGYGAAHNVAIELVNTVSKYHLILNPDIYYSEGLLDELIAYLDANPQFSHLMPKILYPDGNTQHLCRERPTLYNILLKRFTPTFLKKRFKKQLDSYEYKDRDYSDFHYNVPFLSGCFMLFKTDDLVDIGGFDPNFFLYFEDADLSHRFLKKFKNVYYPLNFVYHKYERGTTKSLKHALTAWISFIKFLRKWGIS